MLQLVGGWKTRLGVVWVEGQIAELAVRGNARFRTPRDPIVAVSVRAICSRQVFDAAAPPPADGARVVIFARPDFNANRGSFALTALEIRAVGVGEPRSPGWTGCAASWPRKGFFQPNENGSSLFSPVSSS